MQTQIKAEAEARVVVDTNTGCGHGAPRYFEGYLSDTPKWFLGGSIWLSLGSSSFTVSNGWFVVALQDHETAIYS